MKLAGPLIMVLLLGACASSAPQGSTVKATRNADEVTACQLLGDVETTAGPGGSTDTLLGKRDTLQVLKNKTARLGGNVVLLLGTGGSAEGQAYKCPAAPPQPS